ncbi:MAG: type III pantothenate kinase [Bacteroidaceae bacterium]|nr:type III pantothenate kinase [Bacteroidaceae bacterium]
MNLIVDIGNTRAKLVIFDGECPVEVTATDHNLTALPALAEQYACQRAIVSTTAGMPPLAQERIGALPYPVVHLQADTPLPIRNHYRTPGTLGTDRLAAVVGAQAMKPGRDLLVIDCGTCITYDLLDREGNYWGGNISPGVAMRLEAMHRLTARLPLVEREGPVPQVGYDTETAIRCGVMQGVGHEIEGFIRYFQKKYPSVLVFLTGGDARNLDISKNCTIFADEILVPRGLNQILNYNQ